MKSEKHSILIVEDRTEISLRLREAVRLAKSLDVVGVADTLATGLNMLYEFRPRVVLVDLGLPDGSGIDLVQAASGADWTCDALVISIFGDEARVIEAIQAGAKGYLLKSGGLDDIGQDILSVLEGGSPISPAIARHLLTMLKHQVNLDSKPKIELTGREIEILNAVALGYKRREIGEKFNISTGTVGNHINSIYRKLNVGSNTEAIAKAARIGLL